MAVSLGGIYDLEDLALESGTTVRYPDGRKFNEERMVGKRSPRVPQAPPKAVPAAPPAPPQPAPSGITAEMFSQLISLMNRPIEVTMPTIPPPQITVTAPTQAASAVSAAPTQWSFEFERNPNGTIKRINATAIKE